jgi:aminoglycoside phosphotransferase (APT) family kinase protein
MSGDEIDPHAILTSLGFPEVQALQRVVGGLETRLWRFETLDGRRHALRVYPGSQFAHAARKEEAALRACLPAGVPVPAVEATGQWEGRPVLVLSWCAGETCLAAIQRRPWSLWRAGLSLGRQQARIHRVAPPSFLLEGAPDYWLARGAAQGPEIVAHMRRIGVSTSSLIHLDYHPINVLMDSQGITGVVDWSNGSAGDSRADVARTSALLLMASVPPGPVRLMAVAGRRLLYLAWRRGYVSEAGPVGDLAPFMAWAGATWLQDLVDHRSQPESWLGDKSVPAVNRWVQRWRRRAGIP